MGVDLIADGRVDRSVSPREAKIGKDQHVERWVQESNGNEVVYT